MLMQRACVGGRNRADFQKFLTQNRANFNRKTARFRRQKCAQRARNARRVSAHGFDAAWPMFVTSAHVWQALGACRAQKSRRISSTILRFGFDLISPTKMRPRFSWGGKSALHTPNFPMNSRPFQCSSIDLLFGFAPFSMLGRCSVVDSLCGFAPITVPEH